MNEMDARRQLLADPHHLDAQLEAQLRADANLAALRASLLACDNAIAEELVTVVPPKGLSDRIILRARYRKSARWGLALAASTLLAAAITFGLMPGSPEAVSVAMIDHVIASPEELADDGVVSNERARASLQQIGVSLRGSGYLIRHIGECVVAGRVGRHIVVNTTAGLVTLLVLPTSSGELSRQRTLNKGNFVALILPQPKLAVAVVGSSGMAPSQLESLARQMLTLES